MNPQPLKNVNADVWDKMMEDAFIPASGSTQQTSTRGIVVRQVQPFDRPQGKGARLIVSEKDNLINRKASLIKFTSKKGASYNGIYKIVNRGKWFVDIDTPYIGDAVGNAIPMLGDSNFSNAGGKRRTCGGRPKCLVNCGKDKNKNKPCCQNLQSWVRCVDELRKQNVSAGVPADTGVYEETTPTPTPDQTESGGYPEKGPSTMDTTTKVLIGTGIAVVLLVGGWYVNKVRKGKVVKTAPPVIVAQ